MPLVPVSFVPDAPSPPRDVRRLIREADRRVGDLQRDSRLPAFVASDFGVIYAALHTLEGLGLPAGRWLCEWGSGLGVVSCLAVMVGFDSWGIEIESELVESARCLAEDYDLPAEFVHGSFIPEGAERFLDRGPSYKWLTTSGVSGYQEMGLDVADFDVVFAYPWPDEERLVGDLFERYARAGALLMTYHGGDDVRLRRKRLTAVKA